MFSGRIVSCFCLIVALSLMERAGAQIITNAYDEAGNYAANGNFYTGDNLGTGFGAWTITDGDQSLAANEAAQYGQYSFTLANSAANALATANRPFGNALPVGGSFSVRLRLNHLDSSSNTNGFELQDASGNVLFSYWHQGGDNANGWYTDAAGVGVATNFTYNFSTFSSFTFTLDTANTYTFKDINTGASFSGTLSGAAITQVTFFRANGGTDASDGQDLNFNALAITTLGAKPVFAEQPKTSAAIAGGSLNLTALATSNLGTPAYQWYFTNGPIVGATATNLMLTNVAVTNAGNYYVVASNAAGVATSAVAVVTIIPFGFTNAYDVAANYSGFTGNQGFGFGPWTVSTAGGGSYIGGGNLPLFAIWNSTAFAQSTAVRPFNAALPVGGSLLVQLQMNNLDTGSNTNSLELQDANGNVLFSYYHVGGDNNDGWYTDANGTGVATGFAYDYSQVDAFAFTLTSATTYTFTDLATGASFSGTLSGAPITQVTFLRANGDSSPGNGQDFKFTGLTILSPNGNPPQFSVQPQYNGGLVGSTINLTGTAVSSSGSVTYQWYYGDTLLAGATNATLTLTNVALGNSGGYRLVAANNFGASTSIVSVVTVYVDNSRLLAHEGFDYDGSPTAIDGTSQNGGFGWNGPWQIVSGTGGYINPGSLVGDVNVPPGYDALAVGNSYYNYGSSRTGRWLDCSTNGVIASRGYLDAAGNIGAPGKTLYVSFLMQPDVTGKFYEFEFHRADLGDPGRIGGVGNDTSTNEVFFRQPNGTFVDLGVGDSFEDASVGNHAVDFYVVRIDFQPGHADNVSVYRNPTSLMEPAIPTVTLTNVGNMSFNGISFGAFGNYVAMDEVRLGATWADALGMPAANRMLAPLKSGGTWTVQFAGNPSFTYRVQRAPAVTGPWTDLGTATPAENGLGSFADPTAPTGQAYYRVVTP
ncbi:MAG TPA: immunoglobulin domain-containing protein [Dongiaceae bacterium]|nr:immunoglobulin domain-containing protein [Dongiaceae bacterium]